MKQLQRIVTSLGALHSNQTYTYQAEKKMVMNGVFPFAVPAEGALARCSWFLMHMYLLNQFLHPVFEEFRVNITMTNEPIAQLEVRNVNEQLIGLRTVRADHLQNIKNTTEVSSLESLESFGRHIM